jgi:hypothetical protein
MDHGMPLTRGSQPSGAQDWSYAALASLYWHALKSPTLPSGFAAFPVDSSFRILERARNDHKLMGARIHLQAGNAWDDQIHRLIESALPDHARPLPSRDAERVHQILRSHDLFVPKKPSQAWVNAVRDSMQFLSSISLHSSVELLTSAFGFPGTATPMAMAASASNCLMGDVPPAVEIQRRLG